MRAQLLQYLKSPQTSTSQLAVTYLLQKLIFYHTRKMCAIQMNLPEAITSSAINHFWGKTVMITFYVTSDWMRISDNCYKLYLWQLLKKITLHWTIYCISFPFFNAYESMLCKKAHKNKKTNLILPVSSNYLY